MKNLDEFAAEETGEEWLRELYKVIALRRNAMFRMITESVRLLLLGNAGGSGIAFRLDERLRAVRRPLPITGSP